MSHPVSRPTGHPSSMNSSRGTGTAPSARPVTPPSSNRQRRQVGLPVDILIVVSLGPPDGGLIAGHQKLDQRGPFVA